MTPILSPWSRSAPAKARLPKNLRQRVLVVEDELTIGEIAGEALTGARFEVFTAASAEEAEVILADVSIVSGANQGARDSSGLAFMTQSHSCQSRPLI